MVGFSPRRRCEHPEARRRLSFMALPAMFSTLSAMSFLVFTLLYTPCIAATATIRRELGSGVKTLAVVLGQCVVAWIMSFAVFSVGSLFI